MEPFVPNKLTSILPKSIDDFPGGIVIPVDKPYRWTSADVIRKVKYAACRHFGKKNLKVGHAGTLDPLATGVLLVCIGNATKLAEEFQRHDKEYVAGITLGATTPSFDLEKDIDSRFPFEHITKAAVEDALGGFLGEQDQVAPLFSAKSIDGVRAYEMARKAFKAGLPIPDDIIRASRIVISECELLSFESLPERNEIISDASPASCRINVAEDDFALPHCKIRIACSKGTYIRAFARDLGETLSSGAFLNSLCRTKTGAFKIEDSLTIDEALKLF